MAPPGNRVTARGSGEANPGRQKDATGGPAGIIETHGSPTRMPSRPGTHNIASGNSNGSNGPPARTNAASILLHRRTRADLRVVQADTSSPEDHRVARADSRILAGHRVVPAGRNFLVDRRVVPAGRNFLADHRAVPVDRTFLVDRKVVPADRNLPADHRAVQADRRNGAPIAMADDPKAARKAIGGVRVDSRRSRSCATRDRTLRQRLRAPNSPVPTLGGVKAPNRRLRHVRQNP